MAAILLTFILALALLTVATANSPKDVYWKKLDDAKSIGKGVGRFDHTDYAFPVHDNLAFCRKKVVNMPVDESETDFGPKIAAALQQLSKSGGGTLRFAAGTYFVSSQFEIPSFTCLQGGGMYKTVLKVHPDAPPFPKAGMMRTTYTMRVSLFDLSQDGNRDGLPEEDNPQNRFGIYTHMANYVWMKNVRIVNNPWYGFDPHGANTAWSYYLVIEDCYSANNGKDGFTIDQYYYVSILNSVAVNNDRHGINVVSGSRYVLVKGNKLKDNANCSIVVQNNEFGTRSLRFVENVGMGHRIAGICIRNVFDIQSFRNRMYSDKPGVSMYQLQEVSGAKLINDEWIVTPGVSGKMFTGRGDNLYTVWKTRVIKANRRVIARYARYMRGIDRPLSASVNLRRDDYGEEKADNGVPRAPRRLILRSGGQPTKKLVPRKHTHKQFIDPKGNNPADSDAKCESGIRNGLFCCPKKCGKCVPSNCASMGPECCPEAIRVDASSCDTFGPPCYMSRKYTARGRLYGPKHKDTSGVFPENNDVTFTAENATMSEPSVEPEEPEPPTMAPETNATEPDMPQPMNPEAAVEEPEKKPDMAPEAPAKEESKKTKEDENDDEDDDHEEKGKKKKLVTRSGVPQGSSDEKGDPMCERGIKGSKYACCPKQCGKCGGKGCGKRGSKRGFGKMCCVKYVRKEGRSCESVGAPCIMKKQK